MSNILFLSPSYMGLNRPIYEELLRQGHTVTAIEDCDLPFDYKHRWRGWHDRLLSAWKCRAKRCYQRYWEQQFLHNAALNSHFDLLLCINGVSFHPCLLRHLKRINSSLKSVLYLWDNSSFYDYYHNARWFDRTLTYDLEDSQRYHADLLPFYWMPVICQTNVIKYDMSIVGSNHDNRLAICRKVKEQIVNLTGLREPPPVIYFHIVDSLLPEDDIISHRKMTLEEVQRITALSRCILDTDRETQTGTTPRLVWALAMGKKVVTTNQNIARMPFYNSRQIQIIDRKNPVIDLRFILEDCLYPLDQSLLRLRIDNWVKNLIE
ncbi:hypothetical protein [Alistipes sp.]|uniref:hypothetical protein n=1 Tax=Alistipes sp. TaxID=1872444 RepID=UPI003AEF31EA